ncbi:MAG: head-tail joining protein [Paracoccus sp. (in: a-proteobacteria)]|uniref:head-tail joining protein n=1 Tax=Paracoccus sp. TaxID=267 RepID=UPI0040582293
MNAFAAAMDRIFAHPDMGISAVWIAGGTSEERPIRLICRAPDRITEFGSARILSETLTADIRPSDVPDPRPGDLIVIGADSFSVQGEPIRDRDRLIWTVELVPA